jgi:hypothetical protein
MGHERRIELAPPEVARLARVLALLDGDNDGEALAAMADAKWLLTKAGLAWRDIAYRLAGPKPGPDPQPPLYTREQWRLLAGWCWTWRHLISEIEVAFVIGVSQARQPSVKQWEVLQRIARGLRRWTSGA